MDSRNTGLWGGGANTEVSVQNKKSNPGLHPKKKRVKKVVEKKSPGQKSRQKLEKQSMEEHRNGQEEGELT